ncbi:UDP-Glycosyltransferase/glycogen phosphorylase [Aspergillus carlsbadensis]|nr:UDP-Glycosyltransferase/glycogen phosphorylase [Aspergillus carlsbadensis]
MTTPSKPTVVIACPPAAGHTTPLLTQATYLKQHGHEVHFIAGAESRSAVLDTGASFSAVETAWTPEKFTQMFALPEGHERRIFGIKGYFIDAAPGAMAVLRSVLEGIRARDPDRDVVILQEYTSMGVWPFLFGAPLPKGYTRFPRVITFSTTPMTVSSIDHAPFGPGLPPDSSAEGRARNAALYEAEKPVWDALMENVNEVFGKLGATVTVDKPFFDFLATGADLMLQPCSPSLEYPRSDLASNIRFIGAHPRKELLPETFLPEWWGQLLDAKQDGKKVVFVSQGTFQVDYDMLLKPSIQALATRDDYFVIGVLGVKGATLDGVTIPANTRVVDFLSYDAVLPYVDVFVSNAGYGGFLHGVMNGVPMVLAGSGQDKSEVCARGEWAGIAVNLKTDTPSVDAIRDAVRTVLTDTRYKTRCVQIQRENEALDSCAQVERAIMEFARA